MKRRAVTVLIAISVMLIATRRTVSAQAALFHVSGVVLREGTNVPVPRCHLVMRPEGQRSDHRRLLQDAVPRSAEWTSETDPQGRFAFELPTPGHWQLSATAVGFRMQFYNEHEGFSSAVVVRTGLPPPALIFHLEPDSSVTGFVRDEAGEAVRNAVLMLQPATALQAAGARRQRATTDDRGHYEISGVSPGEYKMSVQATPWYSSGANHAGAQTPSTDPTFDVVYPITWYPGVLDSEVAGQIKLHSGEAAEIDFSLLPVPAARLRVAVPTGISTNPVAVPTIERVEEGAPTGSATLVSTVAGQMEFSGLSPGLYRISTSQPDGHTTTTFLHVTAGATIALSGNDTAGTIDVTCRFSGEEKGVRSQVVLRDVSSGVIFSSASRGSFGLRRRALPVSDSTDQVENERHIAVPAGRYEITLTGDPDLYLTSLTLRDKLVAGRVVQLSGGPVTLTLNVARGRALLTGRALLGDRPIAGAMIMLVPATFGQPGSVDLLRRDQSNTDGSYKLENIVPGDYILLAIDRGWTVNWQDPTILDRYLLRGTPLSIQPHSKPDQEVPAQAP